MQWERSWLSERGLRKSWQRYERVRRCVGAWGSKLAEVMEAVETAGVTGREYRVSVPGMRDTATRHRRVTPAARLNAGGAPAVLLVPDLSCRREGRNPPTGCRQGAPDLGSGRRLARSLTQGHGPSAGRARRALAPAVDSGTSHEDFRSIAGGRGRKHGDSRPFASDAATWSSGPPKPRRAARRGRRGPPPGSPRRAPPARGSAARSPALASIIAGTISARSCIREPSSTAPPDGRLGDGPGGGGFQSRGPLQAQVSRLVVSAVHGATVLGHPEPAAFHAGPDAFANQAPGKRRAPRLRSRLHQRDPIDPAVLPRAGQGLFHEFLGRDQLGCGMEHGVFVEHAVGDRLHPHRGGAVGEPQRSPPDPALHRVQDGVFETARDDERVVVPLPRDARHVAAAEVVQQPAQRDRGARTSISCIPCMT